MTSKVQIINLALNILGENPVISEGDDVKGARVTALLFNDCRDTVLRIHPWNFATKRVRLVAKATAPAFGYSKCFALPADFLRLVRLNDGKDQYAIEADGLLSSVDVANLRYIARIEDTGRYDPLFVQTLAAYIAAEAALPITNSQSLENMARERFFTKLQEARSVDGMENYPDVFLTDVFLEAFFGDDGEVFRPIAPFQSP